LEILFHLARLQNGGERGRLEGATGRERGLRVWREI